MIARDLELLLNKWFLKVPIAEAITFHSDFQKPLVYSENIDRQYSRDFQNFL